MSVAPDVRTTPYGRIVFGAAAVMFGIILVMWHDANAWEDLPLVKLPALIADVFPVLLIAGGIGILLPRFANRAWIVLALVTIAFSLATVPAIVRYPTMYFTWGDFFEFFSLVCGALATTYPRFARIGLGICTVSFAAAQIIYPKITADLVPTWLPPNQMFWVVVTTIAFGLAAIALLINRQARPAAYLMGLMLVLFGLLVWVPILVAHPDKHFNWAEFALNYLIAGAALLVAEHTSEAARAR